jgi:hypothetical protein
MRKLDYNARSVMLGLVIFAFTFRIVTLMMIHTGVDERDYWNSAKAIAQDLPYPELTHRTNRWAIILPVAVVQALFGSHPNVYYVLPILNVMLQAVLAFLIGFRLKGKLAGFLASLALIMFPYMIRAGSQIRPEVFSITYILLAFLSFIEYMDRSDKQSHYLLLTAGWMFLAYQTKITNLFFLPGLLIAILSYKKKLRDAFLLGGSLLVLYVLETGIYAVFTKYKLGMLQIISQKHFSTDNPFILDSFWDLFGRYSFENLQAYWSIPFLLFLIAGFIFVFKLKDSLIGSLVIPTVSFFVCITFEVKSFSPITPAEQFINRYFSAVLGPVFVVLTCAISMLLLNKTPLKNWLKNYRSWKLYGSILVGGMAMLLIVSSLPILPRSVRQYINNPVQVETHPLVLNAKYRREVNNAYDAGIPIVAIKTNAGQNALLTAASYFLDTVHYSNGHLPVAESYFMNGTYYLALRKLKSGKVPSGYLAVVRSPFRMALQNDIELQKISSDSFIGGHNMSESSVNND